MLLVNIDNNCNLLHYVEKRCKRATRSVLEAELLGLLDVLNAAAAIADKLSDILGWKPPVWGCIDSNPVHNLVVRLGNIAEQRLPVDKAVLREEHLTNVLESFLSVPSEENAADGFTK